MIRLKNIEIVVGLEASLKVARVTINGFEDVHICSFFVLHHKVISFLSGTSKMHFPGSNDTK